MAADVMRQVDVVIFPDDENLTAGQSCQCVELLRQRSESPRNADDLPAFARLVRQLAGVIQHDQFSAGGRIVLGQKEDAKQIPSGNSALKTRSSSGLPARMGVLL